MIRGLYTSGWSMMALNKKMDVIANNLANVNTVAYKKDTVIFESFPEVLTRRINDTRSNLNPSGIPGTMELGSDVGEIFTYYKQGQLVRTGSSLDLAVRDSDTAFFTVQVERENGSTIECYTRDGRFMLDSSGRLVTLEGHPVMGVEGPIYLYGGDFTVEDDGTIIQDGMIAARLLIREFANPESLRKYRDNLVVTTEETVEQDFTGNIAQGFTEQSNVNVIREMVHMITVMRSYEANQKIIQTLDGTLEKAVNEVGTVR